jgi:hypothetical protein
MKREFVVAVRNDYGQVLVLVTRGSGTPVFPNGSFDEGSTALIAVRKQIVEDTGLEISGLHLVSAQGKQQQLHLYVAFVTGGKLRKPPSERYSSASWLAYGLVPRIEGLSTVAKDLIRSVFYMHEGTPR